jgi:cell adhesion protein 4
VRPLSPAIIGYTGSIEETTPLHVTCTTTGSRPKATLQWRIGEKDVTSDATELFKYITASDTYTVISDLIYNVGKSDNGQVLICKADNVAAPSDVKTSITLNVKCKVKKYVFICLHN